MSVNDFNWVDWIIVLIVCASAFAGYSRGLIRTAFGFVALAGGVVLASWFYGVPGNAIEPYVPNATIANVIGFVAIMAACSVAAGLIAWALHSLLRLVGLSWLDRLAGGAVGVLRGLLLLAIATLLYTSIYGGTLPRPVMEARLSRYVLRTSSMLSNAAPYTLRTDFQKTYTEFLAGLRSVGRHLAKEK